MAFSIIAIWSAVLLSQRLKGETERRECGGMRIEVEHKGTVVIVGEYDETTGEIGIEDVVNPDTGEVLTDDWFENGDIYDQQLRNKIENQARNSQIEDIL